MTQSRRNDYTVIRAYPLQQVKKLTNLDAIDASWTWTTCEIAKWTSDELSYDLPVGLTDEQFLEWSPGHDYQPLREHTALFIEFSRTPLSKAGILKFAQTYGLLNHTADSWTRQTWERLITDMRKAVALWRAIDHDSSFRREK